MNLVIDVGNTRTKAGIFSGDELLQQLSFPGLLLQEVISEAKNFKITRCLFSSVVDGMAQVEELKKHFPLIILDDRTPLPFKNKYKTPGTLGNDRKANIAGAAKLFPQKNVLVIDAGTCLKTDFINADNEYAGGSISPGLEMRFKSLNQFTSRLPLVSYKPFDRYTGSTTEDSILAGVIFGFIKETEGFIGQYRSDYHQIQVIITGGDASLFDKTLKSSIFVAPYLALSGLNVILNYNVENNKI